MKIKKILFLCTGNSCRSQMADGLAKEHLPNYQIKSAGTKPAPVHPIAIKVMDEIKIDISNNKSKIYSNNDINNADLIITLCSGAMETCIVDNRMNNKHIHWSIDDPALANGNNDKLLNVFRETRDIIKQKILILKKEYE